MAVDISLTALAKILTPIITPLAKECVTVFKEQKLAWDASIAIKNLSAIMVNINTVKTMWSRDKGVAISDFYYPPRLVAKSHTRDPQSLGELLSGTVVVEGIVGQGKSILMRNLCNIALERGVVPIFVELRMVSNDRPLMDLILDNMDASGIKGGKEVFALLARLGKIALILDGFDEVPTNMVTSTIYAVDNLHKKNPDLAIVVSSRPHQSIQRLSEFSVCSIAELTSQDYAPFLQKLISDVVLRENIISALLAAPRNIVGVVTTPLMLTLLCLVYEMESEIPNTLPDFYESLFTAVFSRHDKFKPGFQRERFSGLSESKLQKLFDAFCFMNVQMNIGRTMTDLQFCQIFQRGLKYAAGSECEIEGFRSDIVNVACLMLDDGHGQISYLHKSILEYHAASFVKNSSNEVAELFYSKASENLDLWVQSLTFLGYIDEFRYGKYYVLKYYPAELLSLSALLAGRNKEELVEYINLRFPGFAVIVVGNSASRFIVDVPPVEFPFYHDIFEGFTESVARAMAGTPGKTVQKAIRETPRHASGALAVDAKSVLNNIELDDFWGALTEIEHELMDVIDRYTKVVESELKKHEIFI